MSNITVLFLMSSTLLNLRLKLLKGKSGNMTGGIMNNLETSYAILIGIDNMIAISIPTLRIFTNVYQENIFLGKK